MVARSAGQKAGRGGPGARLRGQRRRSKHGPAGVGGAAQTASIYSTDYTNRLKGSASDPEISRPEETL